MKRILFSPEAATETQSGGTATVPAAIAPEKKEPTAEELRKIAIQSYMDAPTREAKRDVVKQYPFLAQIYSGANHS